jgi:hypothetical protein
MYLLSLSGQQAVGRARLRRKQQDDPMRKLASTEED